MLTHAKFINLRVLTFGRRMFGTILQHKFHTYAIFWLSNLQADVCLGQILLLRCNSETRKYGKHSLPRI